MFAGGHRLDYPLSITRTDRRRPVRESRETAVPDFARSPGRSAKSRKITDNSKGASPPPGAPSRLISSKSSNLVSLSPEEFADSVLSREPAVAVFDCDGTLWDGDSGYDFMVWSIEEGIVSRNASDWIDSRYRLYRAGVVSELAMCGEMVQIYDGLNESEIRRAAAAFFRSRFTDKIFPEMHSLASSLNSRGTEIWAVSSTNNWVVEEGVRSFQHSSLPGHFR